MKQKHNRIVVPVAVAAVLVAVSVVILINHGKTTGNAMPPKPVAAAAQSDFSFTASEAAGWRKGPSNATSLALFNGDDSCFITVSHKTGTLDEAAELQKTQTSLANSGYTSTAGATPTTTIQTKTGHQHYQLHEYTVSGAGSAGQLYGGQAFGFVPLSGGGYLTVQDYCNTAAELPASVPALQAITFHESK